MEGTDLRIAEDLSVDTLKYHIEYLVEKTVEKLKKKDEVLEAKGEEIRGLQARLKEVADEGEAREDSHKESLRVLNEELETVQQTAVESKEEYEQEKHMLVHSELTSIGNELRTLLR